MKAKARVCEAIGSKNYGLTCTTTLIRLNVAITILRPSSMASLKWSDFCGTFRDEHEMKAWEKLLV